MRLPLRPKNGETTRENTIFADLLGETPKPPTQAGWHNEWIFKSMWSIIYKRVYVNKESTQDQSQLCCLSHQIREKLKVYRKQQVDTEISAIESHIASRPLLAKEAWMQMKSWYKYTSDRNPPPSWVITNYIKSEIVAL